MESGCHIDSEVSPVPWLDLVFIDGFSLLVALMPTIEMSIGLEPSDISLVVTISDEVIRRCRIEYIYREAELVF
jgi:hypothetical protein